MKQEEFVEIQKDMNEPITIISPAIEFPCVINRKKLMAKVTEQVDTGVTVSYHVVFSDGYEADFDSIDIDEEISFYESEKKDSEYAKAVNRDLVSIRGFDHSKKLYCIPMNESGEGVNVWILQDTNNENKYSVHTGEYRFTVLKTEKGWQKEHYENSLTEADTALATKVCKLIDSFFK